MKDCSSRTSPTFPSIAVLEVVDLSASTAFSTRSADEEMIVTLAPLKRNAWAAPNPILEEVVSWSRWNKKFGRDGNYPDDPPTTTMRLFRSLSVVYGILNSSWISSVELAGYERMGGLE